MSQGGEPNKRSKQVHKNILPCRRKEALYRAFISPYFSYCSQVWCHCGRRNIEKFERTNARALQFVYNDKISSYEQLLKVGTHGTQGLVRCRYTMGHGRVDKSLEGFTCGDLLHIEITKFRATSLKFWEA